MTTQEIEDTIRKLSGSTIFSVVFTKRTTGEERHMVCRLGVRPKYVASQPKPYEPRDYGLLCVWDLQKGGYRSIPLDAIQSITIRKETYQMEGATC